MRFRSLLSQSASPTRLNTLWRRGLLHDMILRVDKCRPCRKPDPTRGGVRTGLMRPTAWGPRDERSPQLYWRFNQKRLALNVSACRQKCGEAFSLMPAENMQGLKCRPSWHIIYLLSVCMSLFYREGLLWYLTTAWHTPHSTQLLPPVSPTIYDRLAEPVSEVGLVWDKSAGCEDGAVTWSEMRPSFSAK